MKNRRSFMKSEKGQILIWVIAIMLLAALIIPPLLASAWGGLRASTIRQERMQELYAADTGIEDALNWIKNQGNVTRLDEYGIVTFPEIGQQVDYPLGFDTPPFDNLILEDEWSEVNTSDVQVTVERTGNVTYTVTSTGTHKDKGTHVKVQVQVSLETQTFGGGLIEQPPIQNPPQNPPGGPFSYAMASLGEGTPYVASPHGEITGDIYVKGDFDTSGSGGGETQVSGSVWADGNIVLETPSSFITGNASAMGYILLDDGAYIGGNAWSNQSITIDSTRYIGGDAYAQTDINVNNGSIIGSAWANHNVEVDDPGIVRQSAFANNDINVPGGEVEGWAYYLNNLNITDGGSVGNSSKLSVAVGVPPPLMPAIQPNPNPGLTYYNYSRPPNGTIWNGNYILGQNNTIGPLYITGNMYAPKNFKNDITITLMGTVYVHGYIELLNNCRILSIPNQPTPSVLVADGDITIKNNSLGVPDANIPLIMSVNGDISYKNNTIVVGALYAPNGTVTLENNASVSGAIVGQEIVTNNNYEIIYNPAVANIPGLPTGTGWGPPVWPPPEPVPPVYEPLIVVPTGVHINSYIVLED